MKTITTVLALWAALIFPVFAQGPTPAWTVTDLAGRQVTFTKVPDRVVLVRSRDIYELSCLLGNDLEKKLVGWGPDLDKNDHDGWVKFTQRFPRLTQVKTLGDIYSDALDPEELLALKPDLVILDLYFKQVGPKSCEKIEKSGLTVVYTDQSNNPLTSPQAGLELLGKVFHQEAQAQAINSFVNQQIARTQQALAQVKTGPSLYIETGNGGPEKGGPTHGSSGNPPVYTAWAYFLHELKVANIADGQVGATGMAPINREYVLQKDPEVILVTGANWSTPGSMKLGYFTTAAQASGALEGFTQRAGWKSLKAVKNHRLYSIFHGYVMHIFDFAGFQYLAKYLYPKEMSSIDPEKIQKEFYDKFMPIPYSGSWAAAY